MDDIKKLSVVMPVFNEKETIRKIIDKIEKVDLSIEKEIIIVDDCSTDGTTDILKDLKLEKEHTKIIFKNKNQGKGAALKDGFLAATGDIVIIQDADLEYDPEDYKKMLKPMLIGRADVVYGSRFVTGEPKRVIYFWHLWANKFLTFVSNMLSGLTLSDMETCYKAFRKNVLDSFVHTLKSKRFGIEPEITAKVAKGKWRIYEVGISYYGRTYIEGKKIGWKDGLAALWHIVRFNFFK